MASITTAWLETHKTDAVLFESSPHALDAPESKLPSSRLVFEKKPDIVNSVKANLLLTADEAVFVEDPWDFERWWFLLFLIHNQNK